VPHKKYQHFLKGDKDENYKDVCDFGFAAGFGR
jgi:hypothetical protein